MKKSIRFYVALLAIAFVCALTALGHAEKVELTNDVAWCKVSDAYRCCVQQAYLNAMNRLRKLAGDEKAGTWCVVLDADETVISNVPFQEEIQASGEGYSDEGWSEWCNRAEATILPGAKEFCALARELGGKVIIVTNRKEKVKDSTIKNLKEIGLPYDVLLVREGPYAKDRSKLLRRSDIEKGTVKTLPKGMKLPPLKILMLCGDQTHDLYDDKKLSFTNVRDRFAKDLVIIPNPMYGDWSHGGVYVEARKPVAAASEAITWKEAMDRIGENVLVEGTIVSVHAPEKGAAKLNFDENWRESLTLVVFDRERFGDLKSKYLSKKVRVSGKVTKWKGAVQIKVGDPSQIQIVK